MGITYGDHLIDSGYYDRDEPEFCEECHDTAFEIDERGEVVPCTCCHKPITHDDLEDLAAEIATPSDASQADSKSGE